MGVCASKPETLGPPGDESVLPEEGSVSLLTRTLSVREGSEFLSRHHQPAKWTAPYNLSPYPKHQLHSLEREDTTRSIDTVVSEASTVLPDERWVEDVAKRYELLSLLGTGGTSSVHLGRDKRTGKKVAIKVQKRPIEVSDVGLLYNEILVGSQTWLRSSMPKGEVAYDSNFLCHSRSVFLTKHCYGIVMDLASGGNLANYVSSTAGKHVNSKGSRAVTAISEEQARFIFKQLVLGLRHMETCMHCAHRDIKLDNIVIQSDGWQKDRKNAPESKRHCVGRVQFVDFQFSKVCGDDGLTDFVGLLGTPVYMSPELLALKFDPDLRAGQNANEGNDTVCEYDATKADVWALGITLVAMLIAAFPYDDAEPTTMEGLERSIFRSQQSYPWRHAKCVRPFLSFLSKDCISLIDGVLERDPSKRLTVEQILAHPWVEKDFQTRTMRKTWDSILHDEAEHIRMTQVCLTNDVREEDKAAVFNRLHARNAAIRELLMISTKPYDPDCSVLKRVRTEDQLKRLKAQLEVFDRQEIADVIDLRTFEHDHSLEIDLDMMKIYCIPGRH